jgi:hypothetical protein
MKLYNLARMTSATTGTGALTLGAAVSGYLTFAGAGVADGDVVCYGIKDGSNSEAGIGTYTAAGTTLSRAPYKSTNSNAAINCSGSEEVYITALAGDGGDLLPGTTNPMRGFDTPINLQLNASVASNILTIAVKGNNGNDPSTTNPVLIPFRDSTLANGDPIWRAITAALSIDTNATGATLGTASTVPFRLWVVVFDDAGTLKLALWQSVTGGASPTAVAALNEGTLQSTTAISGSATAAGTFYSKNGVAAVASKAFRILGYVDYGSGLATAGSYASAPTTIQLFGPGIKKPGDVVQSAYATSATTTTTSNSALQNATPSIAMTLTSAPNLVRAEACGSFWVASTITATCFARLAMDADTVGFGNYMGLNQLANVSSYSVGAPLKGLNAPGDTSPHTFRPKISGDGTHSASWNRIAVASDTVASLELQEIMV